jgi:hypothetical protein
MGEANLAYARGDTNKAIDICLEVIKYAPKASEPFQLLSLLYSETGANDKSLRVGLIGMYIMYIRCSLLTYCIIIILSLYLNLSPIIKIISYFL